MSVHIGSALNQMNPIKIKGVRKNKSEELEMEIELELELELESGLVCDFIPDFRVQQNTSDIKSVQWRLSGPRTPIDVEFLCEELSGEISTDTTIFSGSNVRLLSE